MTTEVIYPTYEQAQDIVERIAERTKVFHYEMSNNEKEVMTSLLHDIGVTVDQLLDISILADNYAINAEIVRPEDQHNYSEEALEDALFSWQEDNGTHYCIQW